MVRSRLLIFALFSIAATAATIPAAPPPAAIGVEGEWPRWRGPFDNGMARGPAPTTWSATENIQWKAEIPGRGHSSPVIWGDKIFVTTAVPTGPAATQPEARQSAQPSAQRGSGRPKAAGKSGRGQARRRGPGGGAGVAEHRFLLLAYDRNTGKKLWEREATRTTPHEGYHRQYGSFASSSPVTDGKIVIAFFGSRGVFAYDLDGQLQWKKTDFPRQRMRLAFGEGIAPTLHQDTLLLTFDDEGDDDFLLALDKSTGEEKWRTGRKEVSNWAAPLVVKHGGEYQVVVAAPTKVRSYRMTSGELIWEAAGLGLNTIPKPISDGEMVWVMSGYRDPNLLAIRLNGAQGDITDSSQVVWTNQRGNSYSASPVLNDGILYFVTDRGMISAFDAKTGEPHYHQQRLPNPYTLKSSPVGADGKLYVSTESGDVVVLKMGTEFEVLAVNTIEDEFFIATPAIADGRIYLRGIHTLYSIE